MVRFGEGGERRYAAHDQASAPLRPVTRPGDPAPVYPIDEFSPRLSKGRRPSTGANRRNPRLRSVWNWEREVPELQGGGRPDSDQRRSGQLRDVADAREPRPRPLPVGRSEAPQARSPRSGQRQRESQRSDVPQGRPVRSRSQVENIRPGLGDPLGPYRDPRRVASDGHGDGGSQHPPLTNDTALQRGRELAKEVWRSPADRDVRDDFWGGERGRSGRQAADLRSGSARDRKPGPRVAPPTSGGGDRADGRLPVDRRALGRETDVWTRSPGALDTQDSRWWEDERGRDERDVVRHFGGSGRGRASNGGVDSGRRSWREEIEAGLTDFADDLDPGDLDPADLDLGGLDDELDQVDFDEGASTAGGGVRVYDERLGDGAFYSDDSFANAWNAEDPYADLSGIAEDDEPEDPNIRELDLDDDWDDDPDDDPEDPDDGPDGPNGGSRQPVVGTVSSLDARRSSKSLSRNERIDDRRAVATERSQTLMRRRRATIAIGALPLLCLLGWYYTGSGLFLALFVTAGLALAAYLTLLAAVAADERVRQMADAETPSLNSRNGAAWLDDEDEDWRADLGAAPRREVANDDWGDPLGWESGRPAVASGTRDNDPTAPLADPFGQDLLRADRRPQPWAAPVTDMQVRRLRNGSRPDSDVGMPSVRPVKTRPANTPVKRRRYGG